MKENIKIQIIAFLQVIFGYLLVASVLEFLYPTGAGTGKVKIIYFIYFSVLFRVEPHPTVLYNPFTCNIVWRNWINKLNRKSEENY